MRLYCKRDFGMYPGAPVAFHKDLWYDAESDETDTVWVDIPNKEEFSVFGVKIKNMGSVPFSPDQRVSSFWISDYFMTVEEYRESKIDQITS